MNNTARRVAVQACVGALAVAAPLTLAGAAQAAAYARAPFVVARPWEPESTPTRSPRVGT